MLIRPQPKAFFLHVLMYWFMYGMFCAAISVKFMMGESLAHPFWVMFTLLIWGTPIILVRCFFANRNSACEITPRAIIVRHGLFRWNRVLPYKELFKVTIEYSPLFGKSMWYVYFYTKKAAKKRYWPYSASIIGISEADARRLIAVLAEKDIELDVNGIIMSPSLT